MADILNGTSDRILSHLRDLLARLERDRAEVDARIAELQSDIQKRERQNRSESPNKRGRSKRGENLRTIRTLFETSPGVHFTLPEIALATNLPMSSTQVAVTKLTEKGTVKKDQDGGWVYVKPNV